MFRLCIAHTHIEYKIKRSRIIPDRTDRGKPCLAQLCIGEMYHILQPIQVPDRSIKIEGDVIFMLQKEFAYVNQ